MSKEIAVNTVRKWYLSVCHDLCLPEIPIIVKRVGGGGRAGLFVGNRTQEPSGFVAVDLGGVIVGESTGGKVSTSCQISIFATENYCENDYLYALAHELRHAWQFVNNVPPTEEDCNDYASRFLKRFSRPNCEAYRGLVDEKDYEICAAKREAAWNKTVGIILWTSTFFLVLVLSVAGWAELNWVPTFGTGGDMYRSDQVDQANNARHAARVTGYLLFSPLLLWLIAWSAVYLAKMPKVPSSGAARPKADKREQRLKQQQIAYAMRIKNHPDNGKSGRWEVCGCLVTAKTAEEALEKVSDIGRLGSENAVPQYRGKDE